MVTTKATATLLLRVEDPSLQEMFQSWGVHGMGPFPYRVCGFKRMYRDYTDQDRCTLAGEVQFKYYFDRERLVVSFRYLYETKGSAGRYTCRQIEGI